MASRCCSSTPIEAGHACRVRGSVPGAMSSPAWISNRMVQKSFSLMEALTPVFDRCPEKIRFQMIANTSCILQDTASPFGDGSLWRRDWTARPLAHSRHTTPPGAHMRSHPFATGWPVSFASPYGLSFSAFPRNSDPVFLRGFLPSIKRKPFLLQGSHARCRQRLLWPVASKTYDPLFR